LYKHTLNVPVNHYLENVEIPSSLYIPIKQNTYKNVLFSAQGQGLQGWPTQSISFVIKSDWMAGLELLGTGHGGWEGLQTAARLSCYAIKTC